MNTSNYWLTTTSGWITKLVVGGSQLFAIRFLTQALALDDFTVFVILTGISGWFVIADLGVGVVVQNKISELRATNSDYEGILYSLGFVVLKLFLISIVFNLFLSYFFAPFLLSKYDQIDSLNKAFLFFLTAFISSGTSLWSISYKILLSEDKGYLANIFQALATLISLLLLGYVNHQNFQNKLTLGLVFYLLPNFIVSFFVFYKRVFYVFQKKTSKLNSAVKFEFSKKNIQVTLFAVFAMGVVQVDYIVMSQFLTNHEITNYSIISKLFILFFYIYTTILATLWPQLTYYYSLGKKEMIISSIKKALMFGFVLVVMSTLIFCYFNKEVLKLIAPDFDTALPIGLILLFGVYNLVRTWTDTFATFLQSSNKFSVLLYATPLQAMISVVTQILLVKQYGSFGIITGLIASFLLSVSWILPLKTHYILSKL